MPERERESPALSLSLYVWSRLEMAQKGDFSSLLITQWSRITFYAYISQLLPIPSSYFKCNLILSNTILKLKRRRSSNLRPSETKFTRLSFTTCLGLQREAKIIEMTNSMVSVVVVSVVVVVTASATAAAVDDDDGDDDVSHFASSST